MLASMGSRGAGPFRVGFAGVLDADGLAARVFATSAGVRVPDDFARPSRLKLVVRGGGAAGGAAGAFC